MQKVNHEKLIDFEGFRSNGVKNRVLRKISSRIQCAKLIFDGFLMILSSKYLFRSFYFMFFNSWGLLKAIGDSWRRLQTPGDGWRLLETPGDSWRLLETPGDSWRLLEGP